MSGLLAHQGGWDEILLVLGPISIIVGLLRLAKNRVDRDQNRADNPRGAGTETDRTESS